MPATIEYPSYRKIDAPSVVRDRARGQEHSALFPSSYELPESIEFRVSAGGFEAEFTYTIAAHGEAREYVVRESPRLTLSISPASLRILGLRAENARRFFVDERAQIGREEILAIGEDFSQRQQQMLLRSAIIISALLDSVPEPVKRRLYNPAGQHSSR